MHLSILYISPFLNIHKKHHLNISSYFRKAKETHLKLRKERDFHRMHHKRVVQEKDKLIGDIKRYLFVKGLNDLSSISTSN